MPRILFDVLHEQLYGASLSQKNTECESLSSLWSNRKNLSGESDACADRRQQRGTFSTNLFQGDFLEEFHQKLASVSVRMLHKILKSARMQETL